jgi:hypothetical protein
MRHLFLPAGALAVAIWLGPAYAHSHMSDGRKTGTVVVIVAIFLVAWLVLDRRAKAKKREAASNTGRYGFPWSPQAPVRRGK